MSNCGPEYDPLLLPRVVFVTAENGCRAGLIVSYVQQGHQCRSCEPCYSPFAELWRGSLGAKEVAAAAALCRG